MWCADLRAWVEVLLLLVRCMAPTEASPTHQLLIRGGPVLARLRIVYKIAILHGMMDNEEHLCPRVKVELVNLSPDRLFSLRSTVSQGLRFPIGISVI